MKSADRSKKYAFVDICFSSRNEKNKLKSYFKECQTTRPADNSDRDNSARKREQVGPYVKTTRTVLFFYNIVQYLYVYYIIIYLFKRQLLSFSEKELFIQ